VLPQHFLALASSLRNAGGCICASLIRPAQAPKPMNQWMLQVSWPVARSLQILAQVWLFTFGNVTECAAPLQLDALGVGNSKAYLRADNYNNSKQGHRCLKQ
jgi:hypothetical protein